MHNNKATERERTVGSDTHTRREGCWIRTEVRGEIPTDSFGTAAQCPHKARMNCPRNAAPRPTAGERRREESVAVRGSCPTAARSETSCRGSGTHVSSASPKTMPPHRGLQCGAGKASSGSATAPWWTVGSRGGVSRSAPTIHLSPTAIPPAFPSGCPAGNHCSKLSTSSVPLPARAEAAKTPPKK